MAARLPPRTSREPSVFSSIFGWVWKPPWTCPLEAPGRPQAPPRHLPGTILGRFCIDFSGKCPRYFFIDALLGMLYCPDPPSLEDSKPERLEASSLQVASAGDAKRKQSAARRCAPGVLNPDCVSSCRRPDMPVMSLNPCWGHPIRRSSETTEIVALPRWGSHSCGS